MRKRSMGLKQFFKKNNMGFSNSVNEDIARYNINRIFDKWYNNEMKISEIIPDLTKELSSLKFLHNKYKKEENDNRSGEDVYGFENWENNLTYISDRWGCQSRTRWLIDLLEQEKYKS